MLAAKRFQIIILFTTVLFLVGIAVGAQPGFVDPSFNLHDTISAKGTNGSARCIIKQPDGKVIVGGMFYIADGAKKFGLFRLNTDGTLDDGFNVDFRQNNNNFHYTVYCGAIQPDGKIVIGGAFQNIHGFPRQNIARLLTDGSIDTSFDPGAVFGSYVSAISIQQDGKIIAGGSFNQFNSSPVNYLARLNTNGSLDILFSAGGGFNNRVNSVATDATGRIYVSGEFNKYRSVTCKTLVRLLPTGILDSTYTPSLGGGALLLQPDGKLLAASLESSLRRFNEDGSDDITFLASPTSSGKINHISFLQGGKIAIAGSFLEKVLVLNVNGNKDAAFNLSASFNGPVFACCSFGVDKLLVVGDFTSYGNKSYSRVATVGYNGEIDSTFSNNARGFSEQVVTVALTSDKRLVAAGDFNFYDQKHVGYLARLHADGLPDSSFNSIIGADDRIAGIALQPDGKILLGGSFSKYNGIDAKNVSRLFNNGLNDGSFNPPTNLGSNIRSIAVQPDGKILLLSVTTKEIIRLQPNGSIDASFAFPTSPSSYKVLLQAGLQPDGKIIICGSLSSIGGITRSGIARLNSNGSLDNSFNVTVQGDEVRSFLLRPDGKIYILGKFSSVNGVASNGLARLHSDGTLDTTFEAALTPGTIVSAAVWHMGYLYSTSLLDGDPDYITKLVRMDSTGNLDYTFNLVKITGMVWQLLPDSAHLYVAGSFTRVNNTVRNNIAKIQAQVYTPNYTFNGTGSWSNSANWLGGQIPPNPVPAGSVVLVNPSTGGSCTFNGALTISSGATLLIPPNVNFIVNGNIIYL